MRFSLRVSPWLCVLLPVLVLTLPINWFAAAVAAAAIHEICHILAIYLLGGCVRGLEIQIRGAVIQADIPDKKTEILAAAAGPIGSLFLLVFCRSLPRLAMCGFVQGVFNLIPIYPMDGGRILKCAADCLRADASGSD